MTDRIHNFSAGPAVLPVEVLEQAQRELVSLPGVGMSVLEISHRSRHFEDVIARARADLATLLDVPASHKVLFLPGGATLQFAMVPMNLLAGGARADYVLTGSWAKAALKEAQKFGQVRVAASTEADAFTRIPGPSELSVDPGAAYLHYTSNETIQGIQWPAPPVVDGVPLVCDASSDFLSRPWDVRRHGIVYAGAQKNAGPAGVAIVIIREDLLAHTPPGLPALLDYRLMEEHGSLYNTPPVFAIYMVGLVLRWILAGGGLSAMALRNSEKARLLYDCIDESGGYYRPVARADSRSAMNVTFRLGSEALEGLFVKESTAARLDGLKGHRSVGGLRASIYNAFPREGVAALVDFMKDFRRRHG